MWHTTSRLTTFVIGLTLLVGVVFDGLDHPAHPARVRAYQALSMDFRRYHVAVIGDSYTAGTDEGGRGPNSWTERAWQTLARRGWRIVPDVAAQGRAGYGVPGDQGSVFGDLTATAVKPGDVLVVFFGSRNDRGVEPDVLAARARGTFALARRLAPSAALLVIGPPWPGAEVPDWMLQIRDVLNAAAADAGAAFVDPIRSRWFVDRPDLIGADGVHPTDAGHEYLADKIAPFIRIRLPG